MGIKGERMNELIASNMEQVKEEISEHFISSLKEKTRTAYLNDLNYFTDYLGLESIKEMSEYIIKLSHGEANLKALQWRTEMRSRSLAPSTVNRKLAALRSLISFARMLGIINWKLEVKNMKATAYKNVRGPGQSAYQRMISYLDDKGTKQAIRDKAILVLLHDLGLRRAELAKLNYEDISHGEVCTIAVSGKGRDEKELLTLPSETQHMLNDWLKVRGEHKGALFTSFDRAKKGTGRLTPNGIYERIRSIGKAIDIKTHPHAIRHLAITEACKIAQKNGFALEEVMDFSRHKSVLTLMIYRDRERNIQGEISKLLSIHNYRELG